MPPPSLAPVTSVTASGYADGFGRRALAFDREAGTMLERLSLRPEFAAYATALDEAIARTARVVDDRIAAPHRLERDRDSGRIVLVSRFAAGERLSDLLDAACEPSGDEAAATGVDVALGFLVEALAAAEVLRNRAGLAHGALTPSRIVLPPDGGVVLVEPVFSTVLPRLNLTRRRLWCDFGIAVPAAPGPARFDHACDVAQAALTALRLALGRRLDASDPTGGLPALVAEVAEIAQIRGTDGFAAGLRAFFERALPLQGRRPYPDADEALGTVLHLANEIGTDICRESFAEFGRRMQAAVAAPDAPHAVFDRSASLVPHAAAVRAPEPTHVTATDAAPAAVELEAMLVDGAEAPAVPAAEFQVEAAPLDARHEPTDGVPPAASDAATEPSSAIAAPVAESAPAPPDTAPPADSETDVAGDGHAISEVVLEPVVSAEAAADAHAVAAAAEGKPEPEVMLDSTPAAIEPAVITAEDESAPEPSESAPAAEAAADGHPAASVVDEPIDAPGIAAATASEPVPAPELVADAQPATSVGADPSAAPEIAAAKPSEPVPASAPPVVVNPQVAASVTAEPIAVPTAAPARAPFPIRLKPEAPAQRSTAARYEPLSFSAYGAGEAEESSARPRRFAWIAAAAAAVLVAVGFAATRGSAPDRPTPALPADPPKAVAAAAPAEAPAPIPTGTLIIETQPPGAKVLLDGGAAGETPLRIDNVAPGRHVVSLVTDSATVQRTVRVEADTTVRLDVPIFSGWVAIFAPIVLDVVANGRPIGTTDRPRLMLPPGRHRLTMTNRELGYTATEVVEIASGEVRTINLQPQAPVNVNAQPWAEVWIDGRKAGDTPLANLRMPLGTREIVFRHPQLGERRVVTVVRATGQNVVTVDFGKPRPGMSER